LLRAQQEVNRAKEALGDTIAERLSPSPWPDDLVRLARQLSKQQAFDLHKDLIGIRAWSVDATAGATCISLATYIEFVGTVMGMGDLSTRTYIASATLNADGTVSSYNPIVADEGAYAAIPPGQVGPGYWQAANRERKLTLVEGGERNAFEAALIYIVGGETWYIPAGARGKTRAYKDTGTNDGERGADKVLTVMDQLVWWNQRLNVNEQPPLHTYTLAPDDLGP
jgi:hypothetical protein